MHSNILSLFSANHRHFVRAVIAFIFAVTLIYLVMGGNDNLEAAMAESGIPLWVWLLISCIIYCFVLIVPFAPAMELGLLIMALFGLAGIVTVWFTTVVGLSLAYLIGVSWKDLPLIVKFQSSLSSSETTLPKLVEWVLKTFAGSPYLTIAFLINLPGNTFIGGGGGISIIAGAVGHLSFRKFTLTVALASSFLPILFIAGVLNLK